MSSSPSHEESNLVPEHDTTGIESSENDQDDLEQELSDTQDSDEFDADDQDDLDEDDGELVEEEDDDEKPATAPIIGNIIINGNVYVSTEAILNRIPYRIGQPFNPQLTTKLIRNLFKELKRFRNITIETEQIDPNTVTLIINIQEKYPLKDFIFTGNNQLTKKEIYEKLKLDEIPAIDKEELDTIALKIKRLYREKGYHRIDIETELDVDESNKALARFSITEHARAVVKRIEFTGNDHIPSKKLRNIIYTREDWLLSFLDRSGVFQEERLEGDKYAIEQFYQNHGYFNAKVTDVLVEADETNSCFTITYEIQEGDLYTIKDIQVPGNEILSEEFILCRIPIKPGDVYSRELVVETIKALEFVWGEHGYIFAHVDPSIQPDEDTKTVSLAFYTELGKKITLNRITVKGNKKTRDKVIRRQFVLDEGELLTNQKMEISKNRVESLGYFDQREGVNWKINRVGEDLADLDLIVKEARTGNASFQLSFSGTDRSISSPLKGVSMELNVSDINLFGTGIRTNITSRFSHEDVSFMFNMTQPFLFDRPIFGAFDAYHKRLAYEEVHHTLPVNEIDTGGVVTTGFVTRMRTFPWINDVFVRGALGLDNIKYQAIPTAVITRARDEIDRFEAGQAYDILLQKLFRPNTYASLVAQIGQDIRNHPLHPNRGHSWLARAVGAFSGSAGCTGFYKLDFDFHYYTPLIGEYDLIFHWHTFLGFANPFKGRLIPYRDLFHIGGPATVRGFLWGQISPQFGVIDLEDSFLGDSIGASKALYLNVEFIFPIMSDFSVKGLLFYDGGSGWDNPYAKDVPGRFIRHNGFDYRHAVGVGIRLLNPMPLSIDWGFKLDPRKGESVHEVHFNMAYGWS
ncbi:outer membrane protein assembly factor BamA [Candidatus Dependentiae bacterium Noda2021]|nr:outer membrane protein assembly factor BamA [Candidatus Dependentiae bacterium Noda2021]